MRAPFLLFVMQGCAAMPCIGSTWGCATSNLCLHTLHCSCSVIEADSQATCKFMSSCTCTNNSSSSSSRQ